MSKYGVKRSFIFRFNKDQIKYTIEGLRMFLCSTTYSEAVKDNVRKLLEKLEKKVGD